MSFIYDFCWYFAFVGIPGAILSAILAGFAPAVRAVREIIGIVF